MRDGLAVAVLVFAAMAAVIAIPARAGQASAQFNVTVNLQAGGGSAPPAGDFCRITDDPRAFGAIITVVCRTGEVVGISPGRAGVRGSPVHAGVYEFLARFDGSIEGFDVARYVSGMGTTASWRVIHVANREYYEMTLAW